MDAMEVMSVLFLNSQDMFLVLVLGVSAAIIGLMFCPFYRYLGIPLMILGILAATVGGPILNNRDNIRDEYNITEAVQKLEPYKVQLSEARFYLKEMEQKDFLRGEVKGSIGGFFLAFGGSIYGSINQEQKLTVVYYDNDTVIDVKTGIHRVITFSLEKIDIYTIGAGEKPYFKFVPEIETKNSGYQYYNKVSLVVKENPQLYLPDGWQIIDSSERY